MVKVRKRKLAGGGFSLGLDIYVKGKRKYQSLNLHLTGDKLSDRQALELAEKIRRQKEIEIAADLNGVNDLLSGSANFLDYVRKEYAAKHYYKKVSRVLPLLEKYTGGYLPWAQVTISFFEGFINYLRRECKRAEHTVYTDIATVKAILNSAVKQGVILKNPLAYLKNKKPKTTRTYLTPEDLKKLAEAPCPSDRLKDMFMFAVNTGLRISDLKTLRYEDITVYTLTIIMQKTKDTIAIPLNPAAIRYLGTGKGLVFKGVPFSGGTLSKYMAIWKAAAGVNKPVTMHIARHTFATMLLTTGADVTVVRDLLGHSDIRTTLIYAKIVDERKVSAVMNLPEF